MDHASARTAARARATMYPAYDPAAATRAYVDEFGALALLGWLVLGVGLALVVRAGPATATTAPTVAAPVMAAVAAVVAAVEAVPGGRSMIATSRTA